MKVLYADAKKTWHTLMEKVLAPRGVELIHAESLKEVLNKVNTEKPEVAIINVSLKNGKAYEIIPDVLSAGVPVILTGLKSEGFDEKKAKQLGVKFILPKPFTVDELFRFINEARLEKPRMEVKAESSEVVISGGQKGHIQEVSLAPEEDVIEIEPSGGNILHLEEEPELESISIEPQPSEESEITIQPIERESLPEQATAEETPSVSEEEKEKLEQAFGIVPAGGKDAIETQTGKEATSGEEGKSELPEVVPALSGSETAQLSAADVKKLKEEVKQEIINELKREMEETIKSVVWEVIPDMAEKVIREEIEKFIRSRLV
ncbi:response regulator [Desulfurobacterium sp.]